MISRGLRRIRFGMHWILSSGAACALALLLPGALAAQSCDPIPTFADGKQPSRERFVSPGGSDTVGDGSRAAPFKTINRAVRGLQPGDAIRLLPGNYPAGTSLSQLAGTAEAPLWLGGVPGEARPVIAGGSQALHLSRVRYLVVENLEVVGAAQNGINCDDGGDYANPDATRHVLFRNLAFRDIGTGGNQDGLKLSGVHDYAVLDCDFARTSAGGSGIDHVGCHRGVIARCQFTDMGSNSIQCKGGSADIEIRACQFTRGGTRAINLGGSTGFAFFRPPLSPSQPNAEARRIRVIANVFRGGETPIAFVGAVDSLVANNTIVEPQRWLLRILQETITANGHTFLPCGENRFVNNLVYYDRSQISTHVNVGANTAPATFGFSHNLWYALNQPAQSRPTLPAPEQAGLFGLNPRFVNAAQGDFAVATNSPAAGAGTTLPEVKADLRERCFARPPTIGAFEAHPAAPPI